MSPNLLALGQLVRVRDLNAQTAMNGRFGVLFRFPETADAEARYHVRVCTTPDEPLIELQIKAVNIEPIELCVCMCLTFYGDEGEVERLQEALSSINPMLQNDVDADYKAKLLLCYQMDERGFSARGEAGAKDLQRLLDVLGTVMGREGTGDEVVGEEGSNEVVGEEEDEFGAARGLKAQDFRADVVDAKSTLGLAEGEKMLGFLELLHLVTDFVPSSNSWVIFQDLDGLSCSTRMASVQKALMTAADAKKSRICFNSRAEWAASDSSTGGQKVEWEPPRNAEEVDQLVEQGAVTVREGLLETPSLLAYAFRGELVVRAVERLMEKSEFAMRSECGALILARQLAKDLGESTLVFTPEQSPDPDDPKDWIYFPECREECRGIGKATRARITALDKELWGGLSGVKAKNEIETGGGIERTHMSLISKIAI